MGGRSLSARHYAAFGQGGVHGGHKAGIARAERCAEIAACHRQLHFDCTKFAMAQIELRPRIAPRLAGLRKAFDRAFHLRSKPRLTQN